MPCFSKGEGVCHRFASANLANKDYVRALSQYVFKSLVETSGVHAYFTLIYNAAFVLVQKFNGIFNGDDVTTAICVAMVYKRSQ
jgi:hypothetical protein